MHFPEGNSSTNTLCSAICDVMHAHYPFPPLVETFPNILDSNIKYVNNTISIYNAGNKFEILTAEQALEEIIQGRLTGAFPL